MLLKVLYSATLLLPIIFYVLLWKSMGRLFIQDYSSSFLFYIVLPSCVAWIVYFIYTKDYWHLLMPFFIILIIGAPFIYGYSVETLKKRSDERVLDSTDNKQFQSSKLNIHFKYAPSKFDNVQIKEEEGSVVITSGQDQEPVGMIIVSDKEIQIDLKSHLQGMYADKCELIEYEPLERNYMWNGSFLKQYYSGDYELVELESSTSCPKLVEFANKEIFMMNKNIPAKYIYVGLSKDAHALKEVKPSEENAYPDPWYNSLEIK